MFCNMCGQKNANSSRFCTQCGNSILNTDNNSNLGVIDSQGRSNEQIYGEIHTESGSNHRINNNVAHHNQPPFQNFLIPSVIVFALSLILTLYTGCGLGSIGLSVTALYFANKSQDYVKKGIISEAVKNAKESKLFFSIAAGSFGLFLLLAIYLQPSTSGSTDDPNITIEVARNQLLLGQARALADIMGSF